MWAVGLGVICLASGRVEKVGRCRTEVSGGGGGKPGEGCVIQAKKGASGFAGGPGMLRSEECRLPLATGSCWELTKSFKWNLGAG